MTMTSSRRIVPILPGDRTRMSMPLVGMWTVNRSLMWKVCTHFIHFRDNNMKRASSQECPGSFLVGVFDRTEGFVLYECSGIAKKKEEVSHYDWTGLLQLDEIHQQSHKTRCSFRVVVDSEQIERFVDVACEFVENTDDEVVVVSDDDGDDSLEMKEEAEENEKETKAEKEEEEEDTKETNALKVMIDESQDEEEKFKVSEQKEEQTVTPTPITTTTTTTTTTITCDIDRIERVRRALEKVSEKIESLKNVPTMICSNAHSWRSSFVDSNREQEEKSVEKVVIVSENDIVRAKTALSKKNLVESSSDSDVEETVVEETVVEETVVEETVEEAVEETVEEDVEETVEEDTKAEDEESNVPEFVVKEEKVENEERTEIEEEESMLSKYLVLVSEEEDEDEDEETESTDMFLSLDFMNETDHDEEETTPDEMKEDIKSFIRKSNGDIPTIEYVSDEDDEEDLEFSEMYKEDSPEKAMSRKEEDVFMETLRRKYSVVEEVA